ncbi:MAG TPA: hypothetical protein VGE45_13595 [Chloroflexia bacterium]|jgi:hypothetical protein
MEAEQIKRLIIGNLFAVKLLNDSMIDITAHSELCKNLRELAHAWQGLECIDKELMQYIYSFVMVTLNHAQAPGVNAEEREQLWNMYIELDNLVLECLASE